MVLLCCCCGVVVTAVLVFAIDVDAILFNKLYSILFNIVVVMITMKGEDKEVRKCLLSSRRISVSSCC